MSIDIVYVRSDADGRVSDDDPTSDTGERGGSRGNRAVVDVSELPAVRVRAYVETAIPETYREVYLERRGSKAYLTAVD